MATLARSRRGRAAARVTQCGSKPPLLADLGGGGAGGAGRGAGPPSCCRKAARGGAATLGAELRAASA
eukprot:COSAG04_NODE_13392_length_608_cov_0.713163_2_plen_67_part_01